MEAGEAVVRAREMTADRWTTLTRPFGVTMAPDCLPTELPAELLACRSSADVVDADDRAILASLRRHLQKNDPDARRAAAVIDLAWAESVEDSDEAIEVLEGITRQNPADRTAHQDLTVAYETRARLAGGEADWVRALDAAEASARGATALGALVNRALLRERFGLIEEAAGAWDSVGALHPQWRTAAQARARVLSNRPTVAEVRRTLEQPPADPSGLARTHDLAAAHPQIAREVATIVVLPALAAAANDDDTLRYDRIRRHLEALADGVRHRSGDASLAGEATRLRERAEAQRLSVGYRGYADAERAFAEARFGDMASAAARAVPQLTGSVVQPWARYLVAIARYQAFDYRGADSIFAALLDEPAHDGRHSLHGRAAWGRGLVAAREYRLGRSLEFYQRAAASLERSFESEFIGGNQALIVEQLSRSGARAETWAALARALTVLSGHRASYQLSNLLRRAADLAAAEGLLGAAITFQREGLAVARATARVQQPVEATINLGMLTGRLGDLVSSDSMLNAAERDLGRIPDDGMRRRLAVDLRAARVAVALDGGGATTTSGVSLDSVTALLRYFDQAGVRSRTALLRAERAELYLAAHDTPSALADLEESIALIRTAVADLDAPRRLPLAAAERAIARLAALLVTRGRINEALAVSDIARAVRLGRYDGIRADTATRYRYHGHARAFLSLPEGLLVFRIDGRGATVERRAGPQQALVDSIRAFRAGLVAGQHPATMPAGRWLADQILGDDLTDMPDHLVIIPDRILAALPVAALPVGTGGDLVVDHTALRTVPSMRHLMNERAAPEAESGSVVLVSGGPDAPSGLPDLPHARQEVERIGRIHPGARVLPAETGAPAVLAALRDARLLHFAGHAQLSIDPARSRLVVASNGTPAERYVHVADIEASELTHLETVILSSCRTLDADDPDDAGLSSLAAAFLGAGVRDVAGTLWPVDDAGSARLMVELHARLRDGQALADALAGAQRALRDQLGPDVWAAFQVISAR